MNILNESFDGDTKLHFHVQQRNARQRVTLINGFSPDYDTKNLLQQIKRTFCCNGSIQEGNVIQLTGDQRKEVAEYLVGKDIVERRNVIIHGY